MSLPNDDNPGPPTAVQIKEDAIYLDWSDGHRSAYPHRYLRGNCPCAHCVEEMSGRRMVFAENIPSDVTTLDWMPVGRYALTFLFSDAHDTGIYPFPMLRRLCPCSDHRAAQQQE